MEITEETYRVHKVKDNIVSIKEFDDFESAYTYFKKDKEECDAGGINYSYKVTETFYQFDKRKETNK